MADEFQRILKISRNDEVTDNCSEYGSRAVGGCFRSPCIINSLGWPLWRRWQCRRVQQSVHALTADQCLLQPTSHIKRQSSVSQAAQGLQTLAMTTMVITYSHSESDSGSAISVTVTISWNNTARQFIQREAKRQTDRHTDRLAAHWTAVERGLFVTRTRRSAVYLCTDWPIQFYQFKNLERGLLNPDNATFGEFVII